MKKEILEKHLQNKIDQGFFSGSSLIFGNPFQKKIEIHIGKTGKNHNNEINSETVFDLQSITKAVATGPLALALISQGKIHLDQKIGPILNALGIKNDEIYNITFLDLLTHSSGLSDSDLTGDFKSPVDLWAHMFSAKPQFSPGSSIEYTDLGYRILGKVLESILKSNLEIAARNMIWEPMGLKSISYSINNVFNVASTPDAHGVIDDEQVHFLGGILGCDGVFSNANDLFNLMSSLLASNKDVLTQLIKSKRDLNKDCNSYFDSLAFGPKAAGWEVNPARFSYAGKFHTNMTFEKAGGAGTFIWFDADSKNILVYLTNHGKPKPFDEQTWNQLLMDLGPSEISNLIYENL